MFWNNYFVMYLDNFIIMFWDDYIDYIVMLWDDCSIVFWDGYILSSASAPPNDTMYHSINSLKPINHRIIFVQIIFVHTSVLGR